MKARFGDCRLDTDARRLFRGDVEVHLSPKAFELLKLLVENRSRALSKTELLERVWPGTFVSDASLARAVNELRDGVGDRARKPAIIRTVHGFGYAFSADIDEDSGPADRVAAATVCRLVCGTREYALTEGEHVIGRDPDVAVWLDSPKISRRHARLLVEGTLVMLEDLGSKNGTFVDGTRVSSAARLEPGAAIRVGPFKLVFAVGSSGRPTETETTTRAPE